MQLCLKAFCASPLNMPPVFQHDSGIECTPGESKTQDKKENGNYIMYARATSGDKLNNNKFSICSIRNISAVLTKKRDDCFVGNFSLINVFIPVCVRERGPVLMLLCLCVQSLASLSVVTDSWKRENSVTVATAINVKTPAAITPMKRMAKSVNSNLAKSAGQM